MRVPRKRMAALVAYLVQVERVKVADVDVAVVGDREMAALNRRYHHVRGTTDVLSFNLAERGKPVEAQIVVCADEAVRQARRRAQSPQRELLLYVVHGLLHLLGYDDTTQAKARRMHARQEEFLAVFSQ